MHGESSLPATGAEVLESKEIEALGLFPLLLRIPRCMAPEFNQPCLLRVQGQTVLLEPLRKDPHHLFRVLPVLETQDGIISKTNLVSFPFQSGLHHVLEPHIECVMQVDVGQERTDRLPLSRPCFAHEQFAVFDDSDLDPFLNQAEHAAVTYALLHHLDEAAPYNFVEV